MRRRPLVCALVLSLAFSLIATSVHTGDARADANSEARFYFERGNDHLARGLRSRGAPRRRAMEAALADYLQSLRIVRSKNAVYNLAICHDALGHLEEAFDYFAEYLRTELNDAERAEATRRLDSLRPRVAVVEVGSVPAGALVFVDRRDLAARGTTPLSIAVSPGRHTVFVVHEGYAPAEAPVDAAVGQTRRHAVTLTALPAVLSIETSGEPADVWLDGRAVGTTPQRVGVAAGAHEVRLRRAGAEELRERVQVEPGEDRTLHLTLLALPLAGGLAIRANVPAAHATVNGVAWGVVSTSPRGMAPGRYAVEVSAPGYRPASVVVTVPEGRVITVRARLSPEDPPRRYGPLPLIAGISAAASLATGALVGLRAVTRQDALDDAHHDFDEARRQYEQDGAAGRPALLEARERSQDLHDEIQRLNTIADVFYVTAAVLAAATGVMLFTARGDDPGPSTMRTADGTIGPSIAEAR